MVRMSKYVATRYETFDPEEETTPANGAPWATPRGGPTTDDRAIRRILLRWWARSSVEPHEPTVRHPISNGEP
jgi:hypothetical protein